MKLNRTVAASAQDLLLLVKQAVRFNRPQLTRKRLAWMVSAAGEIRICTGEGTSGALFRNVPDVDHKGYSILASLADFGRG